MSVLSTDGLERLPVPFRSPPTSSPLVDTRKQMIKFVSFFSGPARAHSNTVIEYCQTVGAIDHPNNRKAHFYFLARAESLILGRVCAVISICYRSLEAAGRTCPAIRCPLDADGRLRTRASALSTLPGDPQYRKDRALLANSSFSIHPIFRIRTTRHDSSPFLIRARREAQRSPREQSRV